jgi:methanogenic corrinoid protein MtbC1
MVADLLALDGWDDRFLGADVPLEDLVDKIRDIAPKLVAFSVTLPRHIPAVREAIVRTRSAFPDVRILLGGRATLEDEALVESLGVDAVARSGSAAVQVARAWK